MRKKKTLGGGPIMTPPRARIGLRILAKTRMVFFKIVLDFYNNCYIQNPLNLKKILAF